MVYKNGEDTTKNLLEAAREIKRAAFHLWRITQDTRFRFFRNGPEADADPIASSLDRIIKHGDRATFEVKSVIRKIELED